MHTNTTTTTAINTSTNTNVHTITNINAHTTINPDTHTATDIDTNADTTTDTDTTNAHIHTYHHTNAQEHMTHTTGFTIVELLIVIVIIAILAAITIVAYSGIQQRAQNSAIISAAEQTYKLIEGYVSTNDAYPLTGANITACVTSTSGCIDENGSTTAAFATFTTAFTALKTIGNPPTSIPSIGAHGIGIRYNYLASRTADGKAQPALIQYFLFGVNQSCKLPGILSSDWTAPVASGSGYTATGGAQKTMCRVTLPGPSA